MNTELLPSEVKSILNDVIDNNILLAEKGRQPVAINIEGLAGISKTSIVKELGNEKGLHFIRINCAEIESADLVGYPLVEYKMCKGNDCFWISDKLVQDYILQGHHATGEHRMSYAKPMWLVGKEDRPCILLLDDHTRAIPMVLQAAMRITDEQEYVSWSLPKGSTVILTTNPSGGDFLVAESDSAMETRYLTVKMKASVNDWAVWAEKVGVDSRMINFLLKNPEIIEGTSTDKDGNQIKQGNLRQWTKFFDTISFYTNLSENWNKVLNLGQNSLPVEHLMLLHSFIENKLDKLPLITDLLKKDKEWILKELDSCIGEGSKKRNDIASILSRRVMNYAMVNSDSFDKTMVENYQTLLECNYLSQDLVLLCLKKTNTLKPFKTMLLNSPILQNKILGV